MRRFLLFIGLAIIVLPLSAQEGVDSLLARLSRTKEDSNRVNLLSQLCWEYRISNPAKAYDYGYQSIDLAIKLNYTRGMARGYNRLGVVHYRQGNYVEAATALLKALDYWEKLGDKKGMSQSYSNLGNVLSEQGNLKKALEYYLLAVKLLQETGDDTGLSTYYINIGGIYFEEKKYGQARDFYVEALKLARAEGDKGHEGLLLNNLGETMQYMNHYDKALEYYRQALAINEQIPDKSEMANCYMNMGSTYIKQERFADAAICLQKAEALAREVDYKSGVRDIYRHMSDLYEKMDQCDLALMYHRRYSAVSDSLFTEESSIRVGELDARYQNDRRDRELMRKQAEIEKQKAAEKQRLIYFYIALSGALLLLILVFFILRAYRLKQRSNVLLGEQKKEIERKSLELENKNKDITDSIVYSSRIQQAMLPSPEMIRKLLPQSFIFFRPRDIVSGDFYWVEQWGSTILAAAVDCTGHGVPGALMSMVGNNLLSQAVNVYGLNKPSAVLNMINKGLAVTLRQQHEEQTIRDGMDIALVSIDFKAMTAAFAGANNPLWLVRGGILTEYKGDKRPIGAHTGDAAAPFSAHEIEIRSGDMLYLFTDGFADQFGGQEGKKFKYTQLKQLLAAISGLPVAEQERKLARALAEWQGGLDQVDDILVIGIRI